MKAPAALDIAAGRELCIAAFAEHAEAEVRHQVMQARDALATIGQADDERELIVALRAVQLAARRLLYSNPAIERVERMAGDCIVELAEVFAEREGGPL